MSTSLRSNDARWYRDALTALRAEISAVVERTGPGRTYEGLEEELEHIEFAAGAIRQGVTARIALNAEQALSAAEAMDGELPVGVESHNRAAGPTLSEVFREEERD